MPTFKTSRGAREYIIVLVTAVTCLLTGRKREADTDGEGLMHSFLKQPSSFMEVTALLLITSEGGHDSNHTGL